VVEKEQTDEKTSDVETDITFSTQREALATAPIREGTFEMHLRDSGRKTSSELTKSGIEMTNEKQCRCEVLNIIMLFISCFAHSID